MRATAKAATLVAAAGADADEEGVQRPRGLRRRPGGLDEHRPSVAAADLADPPMMGSTETGLADTRVETEIAHQLLWAREAGDVADRRHQSRRHRQIDAGDRHQAFYRRIVQRTLRNLAVEEGEVLAEPVIRASCRLRGRSGGQRDTYGSTLSAQPGESQRRPATNTSSQLIE